MTAQHTSTLPHIPCVLHQPWDRPSGVMSSEDLLQLTIKMHGVICDAWDRWDKYDQEDAPGLGDRLEDIAVTPAPTAAHPPTSEDLLQLAVKMHDVVSEAFGRWDKCDQEDAPALGDRLKEIAWTPVPTAVHPPTSDDKHNESARSEAPRG